MTVDGWRARPRPPLVVEGLEDCLALFGAEPEDTTTDSPAG
jgi:hypothetical protein